MAVSGKIIPLHDKIFVTDINFEEQISAGGIYIPSDDGKDSGIKPRWGRVWAVGPEQTDVKLGEWILMEHGRWTRGIEYIEEDGSKRKIFMVDNNGIMCSADERPSEVSFGLSAVDLSPPEFDFHPE